MAPKTRVKRNAMTASLFAATSRKKQQISFESVTSLRAGNETVPSATGSPGVEEPATMVTTRDAGPTTGLEGTDMAGHRSGGEGTSVASAAAASVKMSVGGPSSRVGEETGSALEDIPATGGEETTAETTAVHSTPRTSQDILGDFAEDWLETLDKDEIKSVSLFLCYHFVHAFSFTETKAAEYAASMMKKSDRTVRRWRSALIDNDGVLPESEQGRYQRSSVLWQNEELNKKAVEYVRDNISVKGHPNLTTVTFCKWVNECFLPNCTLEPGFPRKISLETTRLWLHHLGFEVLTVRKGIFIDGHERPDVIDARKLFLRKMTKIGFLHLSNAPTEGAMRALPDVDAPTSERRSKTVLFFHDESTFMSNEDQTTQWGMKGEKMLKPKSKGSGIMVSDFIDEHNGFLALSDEEHDKAKVSNPRIHKYAREFLEYGESKEGYWTRDKFVAQMHRAIEMAEIKYPKEEGWCHVWVFDHSSCHAAMAADALEVGKMNVKPGGKQRIMHDTTWNGRIWKMYYTERDGRKVAKGMKMVLEERGISTAGKNADWMRETLAELTGP